MSSKYCKECGSILDETSKFCQNCGKAVDKIQNDDLRDSKKNHKPYNSGNTLHCPNCQSTNVTAQIVTENKPTGCLMIFVYIFLALTIIGIPIMIIILLAKGKKTSSKTVYVCQNCGNSFRNNTIVNKNQELSGWKIALIVFMSIFICIFIAVGINENLDTFLSDVNNTYYLGDTINFKYFSVSVDDCQIKYENSPIDDFFVISEPEWIAITFTYTNTTEEERNLTRYKTRIINSKGETIEPSTLYYRIWNVDYLETTRLLPNGKKTGFLQFSNTIKDNPEDLTLQISSSSNFDKYNTYNFKLYSSN